MFIELTRRSNGKKIKVSKHAIASKRDRFTEIHVFGTTVYVEETIQEIEEMMN